VIMDRYIRAEAGGSATDRFKLRSSALMFVAPLLMSWAPVHIYFATIPLLVVMIALAKATTPDFLGSCKQA
jgi:hypothetical protein